MREKESKTDQPDSSKRKRPVGRPPQMVLYIDAKPEDIAWALTNTSPKELKDWKEREGQDAKRE